MKRALILPFVLTSLLMSSCTINNEPSVKPDTPTPQEPEDPKKEDDDNLEEVKQAAINEIEHYVSLDDYDLDEQEKVIGYILACKDKINASTSSSSIQSILNMYKSFIDAVPTIEEQQVDPGDDPDPEPQKTIDDFNDTEQIKKYAELGYKPIYKDTNFKTGYRVTKSFYGAGESPYHDKPLKYYTSTKPTQWTLAQWNSRYDILGEDENSGYTISTDETGFIHTLTSKGKVLNGKEVPGKIVRTNTMTGEVYMESNCSVEYDSPRTGSEGWVHLLHEQDFSDDLTQVSKCTSIVMEAEFTVNKCVNKTGSAYDTNKHAAQLVWYITLQNRTGNHSTNPYYGKYIWFGIPLFDNRFEGKSIGIYRAHDAGTDTLIYSLPSGDVFENGYCPRIGEKAVARVDIIKRVKEAMTYAKENGYLEGTEYEDLYISGTNYGYEVPGVFDIATTINAINIFKK